MTPDRANDDASTIEGGDDQSGGGTWTRRGLIAGVAAAGVGAAAGLTLGVDPADAADGGTVILGEANTAAATTSIETTGQNGFEGVTSAAGFAGVFGSDISSGGNGVGAESISGSGVWARSAGASGLLGVQVAGVVGDSTVNAGVLGLSSLSNGVEGQTSFTTGSGVYGSDSSSGGGFGVSGTSDAGVGVSGSSTTSTGVLGGSEGAGSGLIGESRQGYGVEATGGLAPLLLHPGITPGSPASGAHATGELYVDADGVFYQCTSGGTPGSWSPVGTLLLGGENTSPDSTTISATADNGVYATTTSDGHSGLYASDLSTGGGQGVTGTSTSGTGVSGDSTDGYGLVGTGGLAPLLLTPATSAGAPTTGTHNPGEIYTDVNAVVFVCVSAGAPGTWVQVAAGPTAYASGASCLLPAPIRLLDTRAYATAPDHPGVPITGGDYITVPITGQEVGGVSVPAGAVAVIGNVTAVNAMARGYLTLWPSGVTRPGTSSINFPATTATANGVTVALSSEGTLDIYASQTTDVLFDATGFIA